MNARKSRPAWLRSLSTSLPLLLAVLPVAAGAVCPGIPLPLDTSIGATPLAWMTIGGRTGHVLLDMGATGSAVDAGTLGRPPGGGERALSFSLPSPATGSFRPEDMRAYRAPPGGQRARIGTDILSRRMIEFHYETASPFVIAGLGACDPASLRDRGFVAVGRPGFYGAPAGMRRRDMPDVPVIGLRLGPVVLPAQVDTGFADAVSPGLVQVNAAAIQALRARGVALREVAGASTIGCAGAGVNRRWHVETAALTVVTAGGEAAGTWPPPTLEEKTGTACGGIATFAEPFAQIGASWLIRWRTSVFDGPGGEVWIRR